MHAAQFDNAKCEMQFARFSTAPVQPHSHALASPAWLIPWRLFISCQHPNSTPAVSEPSHQPATKNRIAARIFLLISGRVAWKIVQEDCAKGLLKARVS
eukprot:363070-Chlamydomonas_euryale.AAC.3